MDNVSLVSCDTYDFDKVYDAVKKSIDAVGGIEKFIKKGQKVLLKVNLVEKIEVSRCATTNPLVVCAVAKLAKSAGGIVTIGDSSGGLYTKAYMNKVYEVTEMVKAAEEAGVELNQNFDFQEIFFEQGLVFKRIKVIDAVLNADVVINLVKYKTHSFTGYSACVKNLFGIIPGLEKVKMHAQYPDLKRFSNMLIDIYEYMKSKLVLNVVDAIWGMEGPGPTAGKPKYIGKILASSNAYLLDIALLKLTDNDPYIMPLVNAELERNLITTEDIDNISKYIVGDNFEESIVTDYDNIKPQTFQPTQKVIPNWLQPLFYKVITERPKVNKRKCKGCQKCLRHCPAQAITMKKNKATIDLKKCIRCYCCQELCPYSLVKVKKPWLGRFMDGISSRKAVRKKAKQRSKK